MTFRTFDNINKESRILEHIAQNLSHQNREEARLLFPGVPLRLLIDEQAASTASGFAIYSTAGEPCGIGGLFENGTIWFVVTENAKDELHVSWFKHARRWLAKQHEKYHRIEGYCWSKNTLSQEWMRFMGFDIAPEYTAATKEINGEKFLYFMRTASCAGK